jgi:hypothetical protein
MDNQQFPEVSFYVIAHADDWQIFMQPNAFNDLVAEDGKLVFIVTTAGDAGMDATYWMAREEGLKSSVRFSLAPFGPVMETNCIKKMNNHPILCTSLNNTSSYFLRLPDGGLEGNGFSIHGNKTLSRLEAKEISCIQAIDNSTTYNNWKDFYSTLESIIVYESNGWENKWINYMNPETSLNPNDHPDHIMTGRALQQMEITKELNHAQFVGYSLSGPSEELTQEELFWKTGMLAAYEKAVFDLSGYSTFREDISLYKRWCLSSAVFITK